MKKFYNLTTRSQWGARQPSGAYVELNDADLLGLVFHYSDGVGPQDFTHACAQVRSIQAEHMDGRGFRDIAYSFLISPQGQIFEGRGWRHRSAAQGCQGSDPGTQQLANNHYPAICYLGGKNTELTPAAKRAFLAVRAEFLHLFGENLTTVKGHRDICQTDCPGPNIYKWIKDGIPRP